MTNSLANSMTCEIANISLFFRVFVLKKVLSVHCTKLFTFDLVCLFLSFFLLHSIICQHEL